MYWSTGVYGYGADGVTAAVAAGTAAHAAGVAGRARSAVDELEVRLERLAMVSEALWTLLREKVGITEAELLDRIRAVDLSDGLLDGKVRRPVLECPSCKRPVSSRNVRCIYCSAELKPPPFAV